MTSLLEHLQAMARNNAWCNFRLLNACARLTEEEYRTRRTSSFPSIHLTLNHILVVDWYYLDALDNGGRRWREIYALDDAPCPTLAEVRREQTAADRRLIAYCDHLSAARLEDAVVLYRPGDLEYRERIPDVLAHLFQHDIHHRGQVHATLAGTESRHPSWTSTFSSRTPLCAPTTCARAGAAPALSLNTRPAIRVESGPPPLRIRRVMPMVCRNGRTKT